MHYDMKLRRIFVPKLIFFFTVLSTIRGKLTEKFGVEFFRELLGYLGQPFRGGDPPNIAWPISSLLDMLAS